MINSGALVIAPLHPKIDPLIISNLCIRRNGVIVPDD
jgi:hypothetical protein